MNSNKEKEQEELAIEQEEKVENPCPICGSEMGRGKQCLRCGFCFT